MVIRIYREVGTPSNTIIIIIIIIIHSLFVTGFFVLPFFSFCFSNVSVSILFS